VPPQELMKNYQPATKGTHTATRRLPKNYQTTARILVCSILTGSCMPARIYSNAGTCGGATLSHGRRLLRTEVKSAHRDQIAARNKLRLVPLVQLGQVECKWPAKFDVRVVGGFVFVRAQPTTTPTATQGGLTYVWEALGNLRRLHQWIRSSSGRSRVRPTN
jgi:hypothetical protein